jgi:hypothetical protein
MKKIDRKHERKLNLRNLLSKVNIERKTNHNLNQTKRANIVYSLYSLALRRDFPHVHSQQFGVKRVLSYH